MSLKNISGRKLAALICSAAMVFASVVTPAYAAEKPKATTQVELAKESVSAVLLDSATGTVLFEKNSHQKLPPASVTKVMTMLMIMEAVQNGKVNWKDKIRVSEYAASMGGSQIFLQPGEEMTLEEMLKGIAVASGNDAAVAVAEHLAGSEEEFVKQMNQHAKELGYAWTRISPTSTVCQPKTTTHRHMTSPSCPANCSSMTGSPSSHRSTKITLRKDSEKPFWLVNTNKLVRFYNGMDGLKPGFTAEAKYCLSATAKRNNFRLIAVIMGAPTSQQRNAEISQIILGLRLRELQIRPDLQSRSRSPESPHRQRLAARTATRRS